MTHSHSDAANSAGAVNHSPNSKENPALENDHQRKNEEGGKEDETDALGVLVAAYERDIENDRRNSLPTELN